MDLILRLLWGRRWIVITCVVASLAGGLSVMYVSAPRYSGSARVILDYIRPDPTTGAVVPSKMLEAYLNSQLRLLRDNQVAIPATEALGWMDNPDIQAAYANRNPGDGRDFQSWVASQVINGTYAHMVQDSNIMEITYNGPSKELATTVAEALRTAYIQSSIEAARRAAQSGADATAKQIDKTKTEIAALEDQLQALERETNVLVRPNGADEESARLRNLARANPMRVMGKTADGRTPAAMELRALDEKMARRSVGLGPNNPEVIEMQQQRAALAAQVRAEGDTSESRAAALAASNRESTAELDQQKARVLSLRGPILQLKLLQDELHQKHDILDEQTQALMNLRQEGSKAGGAISPVGEATPSEGAVFPNPWLIIPASLGIGVLMGVLGAMFLEFQGRRVRSVRDLEIATQTPVLAAVPDFSRGRRRPRRSPHPDRRNEPALDAVR